MVINEARIGAIYAGLCGCVGPVFVGYDVYHYGLSPSWFLVPTVLLLCLPFGLAVFLWTLRS